MPLELRETVAVQQCISQRLLGRGFSQEEVNAAMQDVGFCLQLVTTGEGPEPPPPDPDGQITCRGGYLDLTEFWDLFCGDERRNFETRGDVGVMKSNAQAVRFLHEEALDFESARRYKDGRIEFSVFFPTQRVPQGRGGLHLASLTSGHVALGSPSGVSGYPGWLRPDFQLMPGESGTARLRIGTYNLDGAGRKWKDRGDGVLEVVVDTWTPGVILAPGVWNDIVFDWERDGNVMHYTLNGFGEHVFEIHPDSLDFFGFSVGNMDDLELDGGTPEVWYKHWLFTD